MPRLLILGGTADARALADALDQRSGIEVITSLAGRTREPRLPAGQVRTGGFGGADGLAHYLTEAQIDLMIDATHPFAAVISRNAAEAGAQMGIPRLMLLRPAWTPQSGDRWIMVDSADNAADRLADLPGTIFLAIGRQELEPFAQLNDRRFVLRMVEPPSGPLPIADAHVVAGRGPFDLGEEMALFRDHDIGVVVSKNSGGASAYAKIDAARAAAIPVIMIKRPELPYGPRVETIEEAIIWVENNKQLVVD